MINIAIALGAATVTAVFFILLKVHFAISIPLGLVVGIAAFFFLGRKVQEQLEGLLTQMQKDLQAGKIDRAIETLKKGFAFKNRHIFVGSQLNAQIGMLHYLKKDHDAALPYLKKGFFKHYVAMGMLAAIHYKRKDYDQMKNVMDNLVRSNKKEPLVYGLYAYFLSNTKDRDGAIEKLRTGLKQTGGDQKLEQNLTLLQNNKRMKMKVFGDVWVQFMLERPPRIQQQQAPHMRMSRKAMFR